LHGWQHDSPALLLLLLLLLLLGGALWGNCVGSGVGGVCPVAAA
jgi:hypothetical protein